MIRAVNKNDYSQLKYIHEKYFNDEFAFPDFLNKYLCAFVIEDNETIICAAGVRTLTEAIMLTNKDINIKLRRAAMCDLFAAVTYVTKMEGYDNLHTFIKDSNWERHLRKVGFKDIQGKGLVLEI